MWHLNGEAAEKETVETTERSNPEVEEEEKKKADLLFEEIFSKLLGKDVDETEKQEDSEAKASDATFAETVSALMDEIRKEDGEKALEPNSEYEINGHKVETDDNGKIFKIDNRLLPLMEYTEEGTTYRTDSLGRVVWFKGKPAYSEDGERNIRDQVEAGGESRQPGDQGGHLVACVLGGSSGIENIVPMRGKINQGEYKSMELKIANTRLMDKKTFAIMTMRADQLIW